MQGLVYVIFIHKILRVAVRLFFLSRMRLVINQMLASLLFVVIGTSIQSPITDEILTVFFVSAFQVMADRWCIASCI